jgi:hypothetical protein
MEHASESTQLKRGKPSVIRLPAVFHCLLWDNHWEAGDDDRPREDSIKSEGDEGLLLSPVYTLS